MSHTHLLAIDQGTTSSRAILFDADLRPVSISQQEFPQIFPASGWVEHDPEEIWRTTVETCRKAMADVVPAAIGLTNQRETVVVWDKATGVPIHNAIVWQDRRTSSYCADLKAEGAEADVTSRTGLLLDPYFSATKLKWILDQGARDHVNDLLAGTIDTYLIWRLTGGRVHATDATNAARTMLYNIHDGAWDQTLLDLFNIPDSILPEVCDSADDFGITDPAILGAAIPICGVAGDQQAATVGQACFQPGMMKSTYGTGCFALMNTGADAVTSRNRLLTTIAYQLDRKPTYALEGSIFVAGAVVQWLRDGLRMIKVAEETHGLAEAANPTEQVYFVPAFTGLGAPYWNADCRGAIFGLTRNTGPAEIAKAALESVVYQTQDLLEAMRGDWGGQVETVLRVDGGMTASEWTMQRLADQLGAPIDRPVVTETTALGAAYLAGLKLDLCPPPKDFAAKWALDRRFEPAGDADQRARDYAGWKDAVGRLLV